VHARAAAKIEYIEQKLKALAAMKSVLSGLIERCEHCASEDCPILAETRSGHMSGATLKRTLVALPGVGISTPQADVSCCWPLNFEPSQKD
jgi:hypothetical protein